MACAAWRRIADAPCSSPFNTELSLANCISAEVVGRVPFLILASIGPHLFPLSATLPTEFRELGTTKTVPHHRDANAIPLNTPLLLAFSLAAYSAVTCFGRCGPHENSVGPFRIRTCCGSGTDTVSRPSAVSSRKPVSLPPEQKTS